tara:strand:+ start:1 stop:1317 length:1317 start_codon:yes stop_codon:yes gene_type:complete
MNQAYTTQRYFSLIKEWREKLMITNFEKATLKGQLNTIDAQLDRFSKKHLRIVAIGRTGVGKSSLLNSLVNKEIFKTDVGNSCTRNTYACKWDKKISGINQIELVDTPGIDQINSSSTSRLVSHLIIKADLVMFLLCSDITSIEIEALKTISRIGKPLFLILNKCDQWNCKDRKELIKSIQRRLPRELRSIEINQISASPRKSYITNNKKIRSQELSPRIEEFENKLTNLLSTQGDFYLIFNTLVSADTFYNSLKGLRLRKSKSAAQKLIGKFATIKASGVAANPFLIIDFAGSFACDTALIIQLSKLYGLQLKKQSAQELLRKLSFYSSCIGGAQVGIQFLLSTIRHLLILATPLTHGFSLATAAPVALIQAALAVHTTKLTGRIASKELLHGSIRNGIRPKMILKSLLRDPQMNQLIAFRNEIQNLDLKSNQALLP